MVVIAVDIDGTIAGRNVKRFKEICNKEFNLQIPREQLGELFCRAFMGTEEMVSYIRKSSAAKSSVMTRLCTNRTNDTVPQKYWESILSTTGYP